MMDVLTVLVLLGFGCFFAKKKFFSYLKKRRQDAGVEKEERTALPEHRMPDFCILSFNTSDFTYTEDMAHCVEFELEKTIGGLKKEGCQLIGSPFPVVIGSSLLIFLYYQRGTAEMEEVAG